MNPSGSVNEATCPVLGCIAPKKQGGNRYYGGTSVPAGMELHWHIISFHFFHFRFQADGKYNIRPFFENGFELTWNVVRNDYINRWNIIASAT
jgi:hypothetical protein